MKIEINKKLYKFKYKRGLRNGDIVIEKGLKKKDLKFFYEWMKFAQTIRIPSKYKKDLKFKTNFEKGYFKGCFPILSMNEDSVKIVYDYKIIDHNMKWT